MGNGWIAIVNLKALFLRVQNLPHGAGKDIVLCGLGDAAGVEHLVIAFDLAIEFLKLSFKDIRAENQPLKGIGATRRGVRTDDARPPEDGLPERRIILLLDE